MLLLVDVPRISDIDKRKGMSILFMYNIGRTRLFRYNYSFDKVRYDCLTFPCLPNFTFFDTDTEQIVSDINSCNYIEEYLKVKMELYLYCVPESLIDLLRTCSNVENVYTFLNYFWHDLPFKVTPDGIYFNSIFISCKVENVENIKARLLKLRALYGVLEVKS